jgi:hypothetical protein
MDRQKHRRYALIALLLLAAGVALALGRQWISAPEPTPEPRQTSTLPPVARSSRSVPSTTAVEAGGPSTPIPVSTTTSAASAAAFRGRVVDAVTHQPVNQFEIHLTRPRQDTDTEDVQISKTFRSSSGRFSWTGLAEGTWRAAINAPGYQQFNLDELKLSVRATREIAMPLRPGCAVRGRVVELGSGAAVVNAIITARPFGSTQDFSERAPHAKSHGDGSFLLDGISAGDAVLAVFSPGHAPRYVAITVDERTPPQEIGLSAGGTIAGTVVTAAGEPAKGYVTLQGPGGMLFANQTSETAEFAFEHLSAGRYRLSAGTDGTGAGRTSQDMTLGEDEINANVVVVLDAGRSIRGTIRGVRPEQRERIQVFARHEFKAGVSRASIDAQGAYVLNGVPPGNVDVTVFGPGLQLAKRVVVPLDDDVTLDLDFPSGARLSGVVTKGGKPARDTTVWMRSVNDESKFQYYGTTSEEGRYEIDGLPPGDYFVRADDDISRRFTVVDDAVLNIDMPMVQLSARVVEDGAVPIVGAHIYVRGSALETARVLSDSETDDFGRFSLTGIEPGEIVLTVYKAGYELYRENIVYSAPRTNQTITLRKGDGIEVRVKAGSRRFPRGFTLTQTLPGSEYVMDLWMPLNRDGTCHVPSALAGTTFQIGRFSGEPIVFEKWDGQPFELQ